jgi:hypothetical protein
MLGKKDLGRVGVGWNLGSSPVMPHGNDWMIVLAVDCSVPTNLACCSVRQEGSGPMDGI